MGEVQTLITIVSVLTELREEFVRDVVTLEKWSRLKPLYALFDEQEGRNKYCISDTEKLFDPMDTEMIIQEAIFCLKAIRPGAVLSGIAPKGAASAIPVVPDGQRTPVGALCEHCDESRHPPPLADSGVAGRSESSQSHVEVMHVLFELIVEQFRYGTHDTTRAERDACYQLLKHLKTSRSSGYFPPQEHLTKEVSRHAQRGGYEQCVEQAKLLSDLLIEHMKHAGERESDVCWELLSHLNFFIMDVRPRRGYNIFSEVGGCTVL